MSEVHVCFVQERVFVFSFGNKRASRTGTHRRRPHDLRRNVPGLLVANVPQSHGTCESFDHFRIRATLLRSPLDSCVHPSSSLDDCFVVRDDNFHGIHLLWWVWLQSLDGFEDFEGEEGIFLHLLHELVEEDDIDCAVIQHALENPRMLGKLFVELRCCHFRLPPLEKFGKPSALKNIPALLLHMAAHPQRGIYRQVVCRHIAGSLLSALFGSEVQHVQRKRDRRHAGYDDENRRDDM